MGKWLGVGVCGWVVSVCVVGFVCVCGCGWGVGEFVSGWVSV